MKKRKHNSIFKTLAELCYNKAIREDIEKRITAKYEKRINYLVNANNELMKELEECELECYGKREGQEEGARSDKRCELRSNMNDSFVNL